MKITFTRETIAVHLANAQSCELEFGHATYYLHMTDEQKMLPGMTGADVTFTADRSLEGFEDDETPDRIYETETLDDPGFEAVVDSLYDQAAAYFSELDD